MSCKPAISTMSLGRSYAGHSLTHKLTTASSHGIRGIELFYEDLAALTTTQAPSELLAAAAQVRTLCATLNLTIICLQPFMHYEGLLDRAAHESRIQDAKLWIQLAHTLETDLIQVPSSFLPAAQVSPDTALMVADLRELADLGRAATPPVRFAYEALCWGTRVDTWEACWDIVERVDRDNFGMCLDSFNILGRIYADPTAQGGCNVDCDRVVDESVERLVARVGPRVDKVFFIQITDAERLGAVLGPEHPFFKPDQPARMSWSRNCRLFYGETELGAYLPVRKVADAIINRIGYQGWVSFELFNRTMERKDFGVVEELASRCAAGWAKMVEDLGMKVDEREQVTAGKEVDDRKDSTRTSFESSRL